MIEPDTGASLWSASGRTQESVGGVSVQGIKNVDFGATDPKAAYTEMVDTLVAQVTRDLHAEVTRMAALVEVPGRGRSPSPARDAGDSACTHPLPESSPERVQIVLKKRGAHLARSARARARGDPWRCRAGTRDGRT